MFIRQIIFIILLNRTDVKPLIRELSMKEKVQTIINQIRPNLQADGGDIELVDVTADGVVKVRLRGACHGCPGAAMTLKMGVERMLKKSLPEVTSVENVG
jgi:Fe-S cluster biogenesis protein NfuA